MSVSRLVALAAAVLLAALLATGCGSLSKDEYEAEVSEIGETVQEDLDQLEEGAPSPETIDDVQSALEDAADELDGIEPPSEVSGLHEDLVEVLRDTAGLFDELSPLMEQATEDPESMGEQELERMTAVTEEFAGIQERMAKIQEGFADEDYSVGLGDADAGTDADAPAEDAAADE